MYNRLIYGRSGAPATTYSLERNQTINSRYLLIDDNFLSDWCK